MKKFYLIILILISSCKFTFSQSPPFKQFKTSDGLPSPNVYDCIQDSNGYMWFATEYGISRFDMYSFKNFNREDGLNSNFILSIIEKGNQLLIGTQSDGVNVYSADSVSNLNYKENPRLGINKLVLHKNKIYKLNYYNISMIDSDSSVLILDHNNIPNLNSATFRIYCLLSISDERLLASTTEGLFEIEGSEFRKLSVEGIESPIIYDIASDDKKNIYASGDNVIYKIAGDKVTAVYRFGFTNEKKIYRLIADQTGFIWFYVMGEGLFRFNPRNNHLTDLNRHLDADKLHVNDFFLDKKNNVWVNTYGRGVYCFYNTFINNYSTKDGLSNSKINSVSGDKDGRIYCGTFNGLSVLDEDNFIDIKTKGSINLTDYVRSVYKTNDSLFVICYSNDNTGFYNINYRNTILLYSSFRSSIFIDADTLISGAWDNELSFTTPFTNSNAYSNSDFIFAVGDSLKKNKINGLAKGSNGNIWITSDLGISLLHDNNVKVIEKDRLNSKFSSIKEDNYGFIWACGEKGLFIIKDESVVSEFSKNINENVTCFEFDSEDQAWIATNKGLYGMSVQRSDSSIALIEELRLNENDGFISDDISGLYYDKKDNRLWAGTSNGLTSIDLNEIKKQLDKSLQVKILYLGTSDSSYILNGQISFPDHTNNIMIFYSSFDLNSKGNIQYRYKLSDDDTTWNISNENFILFPSLAYGNYNFKIYAENNFGKPGNISEINFKVETPFTRSYFFYSMIALFAMSMTGFAVSRIYRKRYALEKERNNYKNQISDLKQRSLISMMNPHFVFNSLNSIQSFYNYKDNESANEYLAKFSKLIRMNLDFADRTFIKLSDELERLESYLMLEKMRFEDNLKYEIWVSNDIEPEKTEIPNMIIQPFVENAIWHGILKSQNEGKVTVNIFHSQLPEEIRNNYHVQIHSSLDNNPSPLDASPSHCIKIEITDNGIGINNSRKTKTSDHVSRGITVVKERLSILHHYSGETELVRITDRSELNVPESGTIVEIFLTPNICKTHRP